jgi:hypothetical protein
VKKEDDGNILCSLKHYVDVSVVADSWEAAADDNVKESWDASEDEAGVKESWDQSSEDEKPDVKEAWDAESDDDKEAESSQRSAVVMCHNVSTRACRTHASLTGQLQS